MMSVLYTTNMGETDIWNLSSHVLTFIGKAVDLGDGPQIPFTIHPQNSGNFGFTIAAQNSGHF
jgi:hypothetical protein